MKMQASLEFLIIAGAIGALVLGALVQYGGVFAGSRSILNISHGNYSVPNVSYYQRPYLEIALPLSSYASQDNNMQIAAYGCSDGTLNVSIGSATASILQDSINGTFYGAATWTDGFDPENGKNMINITYGIRCNGKSYNGSEAFDTVASVAQQTADAGYSAYISRQNESVIYGTSNRSITSLEVFSHCTYVAFNYRPYPIVVQCGTYNAWQFTVPTNPCYDSGSGTQTTCIIPASSVYNLVTVGQRAPSYSYSGSLNLIGGNRSPLYSQISNASVNSSLFYNGASIGDVHIYNVSSETQLPNVAMITGNGTRYVNSSSISQYQQALNSLYSVLGYYNNTGLNQAGQSQIQQATAAYNTSMRRLIAQQGSDDHTCAFARNSLICHSVYPFYYIINVTAPANYIGSNQTLSYEGSVIRVSD